VSGHYAVAWREGDMWVVNVYGVGVTQAHTRDDVPRMAADLIASLDYEPDDVVVHYVATAR
jgi:hypothetical protein